MRAALYSERPEIRTLAYALRLDDAQERSAYLQSAINTLEELDDFVEFVKAGIEYFDYEGIQVRHNSLSTTCRM